MPRRATTPVESVRTAPPRRPYPIPSPAIISGADPAATSQQGASYQTCLVRAALYARVSTEKQERDDTIGSQVDLAPLW